MGIELFSSRIKEIRKKMGYTQKQFSSVIGISMATLSAYENGSKKPSMDILVSIAEKFTISLDWLCGLSDIVDPGDKPRNYTDIIDMFFKIEDSDLFFLRNVKGNFPGAFGLCTCIAFNDPLISVFLDSWEKTHKLYEDGIIDKTIYTAWKDKIRKDFNDRIIKSDQQSEELYSFLLSDNTMNDYEKIITALHQANLPSSYTPVENDSEDK